MNPQCQPHGIEVSAGIHQLREDEESVSICSLLADDRLYGIDTRTIREVLGHKALERVPLAPCYIGGVLPYRGDVLTVVSFCALLGLKPHANPGCVLVLKSVEEEPFGLMVDSVGGVVMLGQDSFAVNPSTLDVVGRALYSGAFRLNKGLLIQLDPERLRPSRLAETGLFGGKSARVWEEIQCER
jgi:purine-binding chemotaxis protein CheW